MRRLPSSRIEVIDALVLEGGNPLLTAALLEKDEHLTDALRALFALNLDGLQLVLCGGTSLSKAFAMIERMSEDADLKVILSSDLASQSNNRIRNRLRELKTSIKTTLADLGFTEDVDKALAFNENRYIHTQWAYAKHYESAVGARPNLQIETTVRSPILPLEICRLTSLAGRLAPHVDTGGFDAPIVSRSETLAEKVLSFLRRFAQHRSGKMNREWDTKLVRHIYDVHCMCRAAPELLAPAEIAFATLVQQDVDEFGTQHPEFAERPYEILSAALTQLVSDSQTAQEYQENLLPLVYGQDRSAFEDAFSTFATTANQLLATISR
jgi:predicted nucleotidyltransferase component of viral defense system